MIRLIERLSNWRAFAVLMLAYVVVFGAILLTLTDLTAHTRGIGILDFDIGYSVERVAEVFGAYGEPGIALYGRIQLLDILNPALYTLIFAIVLNVLWQVRAAWVVLLPLLAGLLDYAENITLALLARSFPELSSGLVGFSSTLSLVKNAALYASIAVLIVGLALWARDRFSASR